MLYALPDHEVMETLLPDLVQPPIDPEQARERLREEPGLVPIAIRPDQGGIVYFADIGDEPFLEWKYIYTVERLIKTGRINSFFATRLEVLDDPAPISDGVPLNALIFHVSRCGSTLFCKALARLSSNLIINQGGPLQSGFWAAATDGWTRPLEPTAANLDRLRNLVAMMTRRRRPEYNRAFIKFISWNTVYIDFIRAAFPDTPALYLYRDPAEVISVVMEETTAALKLRHTPLAPTLTGLPREQIDALDDIEFLAHCYACYFRTVAEQPSGAGLGLSNFRNTSQRRNFPEILRRGLGWEPDEDRLAAMQAQYDYYSKDDSNQTVYEGEPDLRARLGDPNCRKIDEIVAAPYRVLEQSPDNLFA